MPCHSAISKRSWACFALVAATLATDLAAGFSAAVAAPPETPTARVDRSSVPARGKQSATLTVDAFGRYAVTVSSKQGVGLQSVDRMAGAGPVTGEAGKQDGRLDLFLDRGETRIVTYGAARASGQAKVTAHAFRELNAKPPLLVEQRLESATLGDFEQRSYWLEIKEKRHVVLEAAGRHLADMRLWRDGTWLVDVAPQLVHSQARPEQPLAVARFAVELPPGLYLLTAYGGPSQPWTEASDAKPFFLRFGIPTLGPEMRQQFTMGEFGVERFVVPAGPNYFRLELPSADAATLQVGSYSPQSAFRSDGQSASIDKKSLPPVAEMHQGGSGERLVTVTMAAGKPFVLQHFESRASYRFRGSGEHWISSIHAGHVEDSVGAGAVLTRQPRFGREEYLAEQAIELDRNTTWHRRFNLLDELTLFVKLPAAAKIRVQGDGVRARYRFEPFLTSRPHDYKSPPWRASGQVFDLDRGLYVLSVKPETRGILDLHLLPPGGKPSATLSPVVAAVRFPAQRLETDSSYTLYLNRQPGVASGVVVRRLPIDLAFPLPVTQRPGETLTIPVLIPERGSLRALAEDGRALEITLDGGRKGAAVEVDKGQYRVSVDGKGAALSYSLALEPTRLASRTPLPPLPDAALAGLPKFQTITPAAPIYLDLERRSAETYNVRVGQPGLYQFETTGLLRTDGKVRTRVNPALFEASENGVGRNFQIQRYLREGDYQLTLSTRGETQGHLGVQISRTDVIDGGELRQGEVARALLPSGQALVYRFRIGKRGQYHLQTLGLGRNFELRLEDGNGWPVFAPIERGDLTRELAPGNYRVVILPQTAEARVLTRLDRVVTAKRFKGHGPHRIALETTVEHTWREPTKSPAKNAAKGAARSRARRPDQWEFVLPAAGQVTVTLDSEMEAQLVRRDDPARVLAQVDARQPWRGELAAGRYRLNTRHSRKNNHVPYTLRVAATQLMAGQSRMVAAPASIPLAVGSDGLIELQSFGAADVRARLIDAAGETIAGNDDRSGDWNFQIARRLRPGEYRLLVEPVSDKHAPTTVSMHVPGEVAENPLPLNTDVAIKDARVHLYPLSLPVEHNVLLVSAKSSDAVGLALEGESALGWVSLGTSLGKAPYLALPLGGERFTAYRLRAWSADRRSLRLVLRAVAATLPSVSESQWLQGRLTPVRVDDKRPGLKLAMVALSRPGVFSRAGDPARQPWSDSASRSAQAGGSPVIGVSGKFLWLVADDATDEKTPLAAERLRLPSGEHESLRLELMPGQLASFDLQPNAQGPSLVLAQTRTGQPGVALNEARNPAATGFVPGEAVSVLLPGAAASARVWNAASTAQPLELDLRQVPLQQTAGLTLAFGISDGAITARGALPIKLPDGPMRVRLTLPPRHAAVFVKRGAIVSTHWAGDEALQETVAADADRLWLLNAGAVDANYSLEVAPGNGEAEAALKPGELLERNLGTAGRLRIRVKLPAELPVEAASGGAGESGDAGDYRLRVRGNAQALWQENGGRIESGSDIVLRRSGVLWLQHQPGTVVVWVDEPRSEGGERLGRRPESLQETAVRPPQSVSLKGKQQVLSFNLERAAMLHLRSAVPVVTQFLLDGQPARTEAHLHGANVNLAAPAGASRLLLRALGADSLSGVATVMATPVTELVDGAGPEVLLAPGSARLFSFELKQPATVGIGVRASSDVVRSVLTDERGAVQAEGVVQMPTLTPGRYYLAVEMPPDSAPVRVQPIVLGLKPPDTRPPYEILRRFVEAKAGGEALLYVPPPPTPPPGSDGAPEESAAVEGEGEGEEGGEQNESSEIGEAEFEASQNPDEEMK